MAGRKAPENETKADRFKRLANGRYAVAVSAIDSIAKLTGSQYESTPDQHKKLCDAIRAKVDAAEKQLAANKPGARAKEGVL